MLRCRGCWNFEQYCTCVLDALNAELPNRCCGCGNRWDYCPCIERPEVVPVEPYDYQAALSFHRQEVLRLFGFEW